MDVNRWGRSTPHTADVLEDIRYLFVCGEVVVVVVDKENEK